MKKSLGALALILGIAVAGGAYAAEPADNTEVKEISTVEELAAVAEDLSGYYVLTADLDLGGAEWTPIGSFVQMGQEGEEAETPSPEAAFTGTFDGQDHTISNFTIQQPEGWCIGLFGCIDNAQVGNFTVKDVKTLGTTMVSDVVGYSHESLVYDIVLENGVVEVNPTELSAEGMYGGIVGCKAQADITIPDGTANAGIIGGGLEMTSVYNCAAEGTITAGNQCYGLGAISGCGFAAQDFMGNEAYNVTITAGENAEGVGDIVGAGFYHEEVAKANGAPYDQPTVYTILNCTAE